MKKRGIAWLLFFVMIVSMIPAGQVKAEDVEEPEDVLPSITAVEDGNTYCESVTFQVTNATKVTDNEGEITSDEAGNYTIQGDGNQHKIVAVNGEQTKEITITVNADHTWGEWVTTKEPTEEEEGEKTRECSVCGEKDTGSIPQLSPKPVFTGIEEGKTYCESVTFQVTDATQVTDNEEEIAADEAGNYTIQGDGNQHKIVAVNGEQTEEITITVNADHIKDMPRNVKSPTCTEEGYTGDIYCKHCDNKMEDGKTISAKGYKWDAGKVTKNSTDSAEGVFTYTCTNGCNHTKTEIIPQKSVTVILGKKANIISNASACQKMSLTNASKYKKYLTFNAKTGVVTTKKYYKVKIKKSIPVKVTVGGKEYTVNVKVKIPAPSVKITRKSGKDSYGKYVKYTFKYNVKGASKIQVRVENAGKTGKKAAINKILDKNVKKPKSNKSSYIGFYNTIMKKLKNKNNKVTFKIIAYYGKNKSETLTITK